MSTPKDITTYKKQSKIIDNPILNVDCPHCYEENIIDTSSIIKCEKCEKPLLTKKDSKILVSSIVAAFIGTGAIAGVLLDDSVEIYKLPLKVEYKMIRTCIDTYSKNGRYNTKVRDTCICAVDTMDGLYDVGKIKNMDSFDRGSVLYERYESCNN